MAQNQNVFLMEALWSRCTPIYEKLRQELAAGTIGKIRQVMVNFGVVINVERVRYKTNELATRCYVFIVAFSITN